MEITHVETHGRYVQIVSPKRLAEILSAEGESLDRPEWMSAEDDWYVPDQFVEILD